MPQDNFQLSGAAAKIYEDQKVPAMFGPLAEATLARHGVDPDDVVLDVACGTGIVGRTIRNQFGGQPTVTGIDLNEAMIATARNICSRAALAIDFHICDVASTPFDDGEFTFVICQQGLQFFPDEQAVLTELRRVASNGARFVFTVWSRPSPLFVAIADSLRVHGGADLAQRSLAPFSWTGAATIERRLGHSGYIDVDIQELEIDRVLNDPAESIPNEIMGNPIGASVVSLGPAVFDTVVKDALDATEQYRHGDRLVIPQHTHLISAAAG